MPQSLVGIWVLGMELCGDVPRMPVRSKEVQIRTFVTFGQSTPEETSSGKSQ